MSDMGSPTDAREIGVIKTMTDKGYGFIRLTMGSDNKPRPDLYVHASECNNEFEDYRCGTKVEFTIGADRNGKRQAVLVRKIR